jgi:hypothetical protein
MPAPTGNLAELLRLHHDDAPSYYTAVGASGGKAFMFWDANLDAWVITGHPECTALLSSPALARSPAVLPRVSGFEDLIDAAENVLKGQMIFSNRPDAPTCRKYWTRMIREPGEKRDTLPNPLCELMIGELPRDREFNAYSELLQPYVSRAVCRRLGLSDAVRDELYPLILNYVRFLDAKLANERDYLAGLYAIVALYSRLSGGGLAMIPPEYSDRRRWVADYLLTVVAGHDSAAYLLGTVLNFCGGPEGLLVTAGTDGLQVARIIQEALRIDSPVQMIGRRALSRVVVGPCEINAGDRVFLHLGAANWDPRVFAAPSIYRLDRDPRSHIAFGAGRSRCIGYSLAIEIVTAFLMEIASRGYAIDVASDRIEWDHGLAGRGLRILPARVAEARRSRRAPPQAEGRL